jgi:EF-hand domain pair
MGLLSGIFKIGKKNKEGDEEEKKKNKGLAERAYQASHPGTDNAATKVTATTTVKKKSVVRATPATSTTATPAAAATAAVATASAAATTAPSSSSTSKWNAVVKNQKIKPTTTAVSKKKPVAQQQQQQKQHKKKKEVVVGNFLTRTQMFQDMLEWAFVQVDADNSGQVDPQELYSGLLLIHLKLGSYAGPAACKPISRAQTQAMFAKVDVDGNGTLSREEFDAVMMVLFGNALLRVAFQYSCTIVLVPLLAQQLLSLVVWMLTKIIVTIVNILDEQTGGDLGDSFDDAWDESWHKFTTLVSSVTPTRLDNAVVSTLFHGYIQKVPASVWNAIPLTLISTILSMMLIPWSLMKIDDYFQALADRKKLGNNEIKMK